MESENQEFWETVMIRCLTNPADTEAQHLLTGWLERSPQNRREFETLTRIWSERAAEPRTINHNDVREQVWQKATMHAAYQKRPRLLRWVAVLSGIMIVATGTFWAAMRFVKEPRYTTQENRAGERSRFMLPDGSEVWLQAGSTIVYPEQFSRHERRVSLRGEAFFQVVKDPDKPFVVDTGDLSTTALGTSFNISAYPDKPSIEVALVTGKVAVARHNTSQEPALLEPGRGAFYRKDTHQLTSGPVATDVVTAWTLGILVFEGDDYAGFVRKIEQWYGVTVTARGKIPQRWSIRGRFDNAYLTQVMEVISFNKGFTYTLNDKNLTIVFPT
jgi:ferric-dicitrate binding protein FerR (iron transport regulator)